MNTRLYKCCALLVACLATIVIAQGQSDQKTEAVSNGISVSKITPYRTMFRINKTPVDMVEGTKFMCAAPRSIYGPHYDPGVVYYINELARQGLKTFSDDKLFPVGSIIVKEKQERRTEDSVQIITVMKKVRPGRDEDSWDYKMFATEKWEEVNAGSGSNNGTCIGCHRRYEGNDFVSDTGIKLLLGK